MGCFDFGIGNMGLSKNWMEKKKEKEKKLISYACFCRDFIGKKE
jgi:hypothetical protein